MYANNDGTKYSITKVSEEYFKFTEGINHKFPGYSLTSTHTPVLKNDSDTDIDLEELVKLFKSKDLERYEEVKGNFFGKQTKLLNGKPC